MYERGKLHGPRSRFFSLLKVAKAELMRVQGRCSSGLEGIIFHQVTMVQFFDCLVFVAIAELVKPSARRGGSGTRVVDEPMA